MTNKGSTSTPSPSSLLPKSSAQSPFSTVAAMLQTATGKVTEVTNEAANMVTSFASLVVAPPQPSIPIVPGSAVSRSFTGPAWDGIKGESYYVENPGGYRYSWSGTPARYTCYTQSSLVTYYYDPDNKRKYFLNTKTGQYEDC